MSRGLLRRNTLTGKISYGDSYCSFCGEFRGRFKVVEVHEASRPCFSNPLMVVGGGAERVGGSYSVSTTVPAASR